MKNWERCFSDKPRKLTLSEFQHAHVAHMRRAILHRLQRRSLWMTRQTTIDLVWQSVGLHPERPALRYLTAERTVGWLSYKQASRCQLHPAACPSSVQCFPNNTWYGGTGQFGKLWGWNVKQWKSHMASLCPLTRSWAVVHMYSRSDIQYTWYYMTMIIMIYLWYSCRPFLDKNPSLFQGCCWGHSNLSQVWHWAGRVAQRLSGSVLAVAIDDGPYLALAELAAWRRCSEPHGSWHRCRQLQTHTQKPY